MSSVSRSFVIGVTLISVTAGCRRETRDFTHGGPSAREIATASTGAEVAQEMNAQALSDGKRLYSQFNCIGCHAAGGGDIGPALRDAKWLYGAGFNDVFTSIMDGRPNGMPAFRGRITESQAKQIAAYVRSLSGLVKSNAATSRDDHMKTTPPENSVDRQEPVLDSAPKL